MVVILPIEVEVAARETETTATIGAFDRPHHRFRFSLRRLDMWIRSFGVNVRAVAHGICRRGDKNILHAGLPFAEAHIEIPFILRLEGLHAARDRMHRKALVVCVPNRIARKTVFVVSADPVLPLRAALVGQHFDGIMRHADAHAFFHQRTQHPESVWLHAGMITPAVGINKYRISPLED